MIREKISQIKYTLLEIVAKRTKLLNERVKAVAEWTKYEAEEDWTLE
ncbi:hypothetical protein [Peribacillus glennii]|nr:hypothetical protein [Peribacillus glennii]